MAPQLSQVRNFRNNTTSVITDKANKKFKEQWTKTAVDLAEDDTRRENILKIVEPLIAKEPTKAVVDVQEVKALIGTATVCWGCLSSTCRTRQLLSQRLVNRF